MLGDCIYVMICHDMSWYVMYHLQVFIMMLIFQHTLDTFPINRRSHPNPKVKEMRWCAGSLFGREIILIYHVLHIFTRCLIWCFNSCLRVVTMFGPCWDLSFSLEEVHLCVFWPLRQEDTQHVAFLWGLWGGDAACPMVKPRAGGVEAAE